MRALCTNPAVLDCSTRSKYRTRERRPQERFDASTSIFFSGNVLLEWLRPRCSHAACTPAVWRRADGHARCPAMRVFMAAVSQCASAVCRSTSFVFMADSGNHNIPELHTGETAQVWLWPWAYVRRAWYACGIGIATDIRMARARAVVQVFFEHVTSAQPNPHSTSAHVFRGILVALQRPPYNYIWVGA